MKNGDKKMRGNMRYIYLLQYAITCETFEAKIAIKEIEKVLDELDFFALRQMKRVICYALRKNLFSEFLREDWGALADKIESTIREMEQHEN